MENILKDLVTSLIGQTNSGTVTLLIGACIYLGWQSWQKDKDHKAEISEYKDTLVKLQAVLNQKTGEEREMLLSIIEKYHQSQISIREAISEVKAVLSTISALSQRGM